MSDLHVSDERNVPSVRFFRPEIDHVNPCQGPLRCSGPLTLAGHGVGGAEVPCRCARRAARRRMHRHS
jgi:hypothetical protein